MSENYYKQRLGFLDLFTKEQKELAGGGAWTLEPRSIKFRHGDSLAELKVPYHLGADDETAIKNAICGLALLLKKRFEVSDKTPGEIPPSVQVNIAQPLRDKTYKIELLLEDSIEKEIATDLLMTVPYLDGAVLINWFGPQGHGKDFIKWFSRLMEKTLQAEAGSDTGEKTSYLALLGVINSIKKCKENLKDLRIRGLSYEKLDIVIGFSVHSLLSRSLTQLFARLKSSDIAYYNADAERTLKSAISPGVFLSISSNLLANSLNPYGMDKELYDAIKPHLGDISTLGGNSDQAALGAFKKIKNDKTIIEKIALQQTISRFRAITVEYLINFDVQGVPAHKLLYDIYPDDRLVKSLFGDLKTLEKIKKSLGEIKKNYEKDTARLEAVGLLEGFLSGFGKAKRKKWFSSSKTEDADDPVEIVKSALACLFDEHIESFVSAMRVYLVDRRSKFDNKTLIDEYKRGRLYRFSTDNRAVLKSLSVDLEGQLFVDMKDFTRRTLQVKEIAMAEFMKENFYMPILDAAAKYKPTEVILETENDLRLNALPGDAAIFSGQLSTLISLAHDIQSVINQYVIKLKKRLPPVKDAFLLSEINRSFQEKKQELKKLRQGLAKSSVKNTSAVKAKMSALAEEEARVENQYREELEAAISHEMEAGVFISYGTKAEIMILEGGKAAQTQLTVAIGEKINEAARGTDRNSAVRIKLEMMLEQERIKRKKPELKYPFDVYIDKTFTVRIPPEICVNIEELPDKEKPTDAKAMATRIARECFEDFMTISSGKSKSSLRVLEQSTGLYNKGQAMSKNALAAYIGEAKGTKFFFRKRIGTRELHESIQKGFFFPSDMLEFWIGYERTATKEILEVFHRSGEIVFKGFEAMDPTVVFEILHPEGGFFKVLKLHHLMKWITEAKKKQ